MTLNKPAILIAEEDRKVRESAERVLKAEGYRIYSVSAPQKAAEILRSHVIHVVVLDIHMGESNPYNREGSMWICRMIKSDQVRSRAPILMLSRAGAPEYVLAARKAGATGFLLKQEVDAQLLKRVKSLLEPRPDAPASQDAAATAGPPARSKLDEFVWYLNEKNIMPAPDIQRTVKFVGRMDRRIGHLAVFLGYILPEQIYDVLMEQCEHGGSFGECAQRRKLLTRPQIEYLLHHQRDDRMLFVQAAAALKTAPADQLFSVFNEYLEPWRDRVWTDADSHELAEYEPDLEVQKTIQRIKALASISRGAHQALAMVFDETVDYDKLADVLSIDPGVTATLLRVVNSSYYGPKNRVLTVKHAMVMMGLDRLHSLLIAVLGLKKFKEIPAEAARPFWERAMWTAEWSKQLGEQFCHSEPQSLFVAGLLQSIGELVVWQFFMPQKKEIDARVAAGVSLPDAEIASLGMTNADIGAFLFRLWEMPGVYVQSAMFRHHSLSMLSVTPNLLSDTSLIYMAGRLAEISLQKGVRGAAIEEAEGQFRTYLKIPTNLGLSDLAKKVAANLGDIRPFIEKGM